MFSLHEKLQQVPWEKLNHAYGSAQDTPTLLLNLLSDQAKQRDQALYELWASICHQGSVYEASCAAVPFLIEILAEVPEQSKADILSLLEGLAHVNMYANKDQRFLRMSRSRRAGHSSHEWLSWGEFLVTGNEFHDPQWMKQAHQLVGEGIESYLALLHSPEADVVQSTLDLLAGFQEYHVQLIPVIVPLAFEKTATPIQIAALRCLGALLEQESPYWQEYQRVTQAPDASPEIKFAAAHTIAWYHPSGGSPEVVETLLTSVLPPQSCDGLQEVCKVLSHMGAPHGFQGLIETLKYGADHWSARDTIRVAEALLDVAFFGGWVEGRHWTYRSRHSLDFCLKVNPTTQKRVYRLGESISSCNPLPDWDKDNAAFHWDYSGMGIQVSTDGLVEYISEYAIDVQGYDTSEAFRLQHLHERDGSQALLDHQRKALEAVLRCDILWTFPQNVLAIYSLPTTRHELEAFLAGK